MKEDIKKVLLLSCQHEDAIHTSEELERKLKKATILLMRKRWAQTGSNLTWELFSVWDASYLVRSYYYYPEIKQLKRGWSFYKIKWFKLCYPEMMSVRFGGANCLLTFRTNGEMEIASSKLLSGENIISVKKERT